MKAVERRRAERVRAFWVRCLQAVSEAGPLSEAPFDIDRFGEVKGYILDRIDLLDNTLKNAARQAAEKQARKSVFLGRKRKILPPVENGLHNAVSEGSARA